MTHSGGNNDQSIANHWKIGVLRNRDTLSSKNKVKSKVNCRFKTNW
jgi:hypothetical protein